MAWVLAVTSAAVVLTTSSSATAAGDCSALLPAPIYGSGGSAQKPLIAKLATKLTNAPAPLTVVYQSPGACVGVNGLFGGTLLAGTAAYWDAAGVEQSCTIPGAGQEIDFAASGNQATTCPGVSAIPPGFGDFLGPVNGYSLIVPKASSQVSISSEGAYFVFGFGQLGQVSPWIDDTQIFRRDSNSAAQLFISLNTGVPPEKFKGIDTKSNTGTITAVAQSAKPETAIGLVSAEVADAARDTVRVLAFQASGQRCGFWPDSSATTFDKKSIREGQYALWAPLHFLSKVGADKKPSKADVARFIALFDTSVDPPTGVNVLEAEIKSGTVPRCAMSVWRDSDIGAISKAPADKPCGCYFDSVATGKSPCTVCSGNGNEGCSGATPVCRYGFCEAK